jgi:alpha-beta hydrolase superfamily lysophospholipase
VQIAHGMAEHGERYEGFAEALCAAGFDVWVMDLLGHGKSAESEEQWGYFGEEHGWKNLVGDIRLMTGLMKDTYPDDLPIFLFGHSMGSFLARAYCERYSEDLAGAAFLTLAALAPDPAVPWSRRPVTWRSRARRWAVAAAASPLVPAGMAADRMIALAFRAADQGNAYRLLARKGDR